MDQNRICTCENKIENIRLALNGAAPVSKKQTCTDYFELTSWQWCQRPLSVFDATMIANGCASASHWGSRSRGFNPGSHHTASVAAKDHRSGR